jgi:prohibitin 1
MASIILSIIFVVILFIGLGFGLNKENRIAYKIRKRQLFSLFGLIIILFGTIKTVGANEVGIIFDPFNGGVQSQTLTEGTHFRAPWVKVYKIDTTSKELAFVGEEDQFAVQTLDSQYIWFQVKIQYNVSPENASRVFKAYRGLPEKNMVKTYVEVAIRDISSQYNIYDIMGDQTTAIRQESLKNLRTVLAERGINVIELNFIDIDGGSEIENVIKQESLAKKQIDINKQLAAAALEEQKKKETEAKTAAEVSRIQAEAAKEVALIEAEAEAEKKLLIAEGEYKAAEQQALALLELARADAEARLEKIKAFLPANYDSLGDPEKTTAWDVALSSYLQQLAYEAWNGDVPDTILDSNGDYIWNLNN